uniref:non-specific serine/threonine protein kinase n=1 Tax=Nelumbo nucifera TaxID=4432 RepID=A0A822XRV0_NELNU|nr:TPA_asm: hypothetical protein HUJ06_024205 [Nelumbo nucifera]
MVSGLIVSVLFKLLLICIRGRVKDSGLAIFNPLIKKAEDLAFLEKEDGLASLEIIERGRCGEKIITIKKIIQPNPIDVVELAEEDNMLLTKKMWQIRSEIQTMDCHYLVYEYMKNGSARQLDWLVRHKIALGVSAGLEYLHMHHNPRIIHKYLKPENILLDDDMEAHIADFGLAKAVPEMNTHVTTSNVAGTVGYIALEYHQTLKFTDRYDSYNFGIILAVLVKWLKNQMILENPSAPINPKLKGNGRYVGNYLAVFYFSLICV